MSLRLRLALWYSGVTGVIVLLLGLLSYIAYGRAQYDAMDRALAGAVEHVALTQDTSLRDVTTMLQAPILPDVAVLVYDRQGRVLAASPNAVMAPEVDPSSLLEQPSGPAYGWVTFLFALDQPGDGVFALFSNATGGRWRYYVLPVGEEEQLLVVAAASLSSIDASVRTFWQLVPLLALFSAMITLLVGRWVAGWALHPVAALTETAHAIAHSQELDRRVSVHSRTDEMGQLALTFNEMLASLEQASQAQQRFVSDASHELRAPLTAIQGNLELIERQPHMPAAERQEAVAEASREARRLAQLVSDLLALARADAGLPLRQELIELDRVLLDTMNQARHLARGQTLRLGEFDTVTIVGDEDRLKQLLLILLDNAFKYTPADGQVTLDLKRDGSTARISVSDTGVGIPAEALPSVFERFYRADPARRRDPGGTGLGLSIARWIAEQHGAEISLRSEAGRGTTATVRFPLPG